MGEDLRVDTLREAYRKGIFPWPHDGLPLPWFSPRRRAVLFFDDLHVGRSLRKSQKNAALTFTIDRDFDSVIQACAEMERPERSEERRVGESVDLGGGRMMREKDRTAV